MRILDTLSKVQKETGTSKVRIYLCGVTVYDKSHIGHARTIIVFDVLQRYLEDLGAEVELVQNFTDIDDKIIEKAKSENRTAKEITDRYIDCYFEDFDRLNVRRATLYPKATEHIPDIIQFIEGLVEKNIAYLSENGVYFAVSKFPEYGKLSKKMIGDLRSGARIKVDEKKEDPLDFALWKFSDVKPVWSSPWGAGRPGWHIECSAMSIKYLGENFDIHGGGRDLIFPHHENEIAQSESYTDCQFARIWMHVGMVTIDGEKMSKSVGNVRSIRHVLENWGPNIIRLFCLSGHYSKPIDYTEELLKENLVKWRQVETCYYELYHADGGNGREDGFSKTLHERFNGALDDDFNTHLALTAFFQLVRETNQLAAEEKINDVNACSIKTELDRMLSILGLNIPEMGDKERVEIDGLVNDRERARRERRFGDADAIRDRLNGMNIELIDHKTRTIWMRKENIRKE